MLKRLQLFEFCDQAWLPSLVREMFLDCLNLLHLVARPYKNTKKLFKKLSSITNSQEILDLGSGGAEHLEHIIRSRINEINGNNSFPKLIASDLYPDTKRYQKMKKELGEKFFSFYEDRVNALELSNTPFKAFSTCTTFHHFKPEKARQLLGTILNTNAGLLILELNSRRLDQLLLTLSALPFLMLAPFFAKRKSFSKFMLGTIIPIVPLMVLFDGIVSVLRSYKPEEILNLLPEGSLSNLRFESTEIKYFGLFRGRATLIYPASLITNKKRSIKRNTHLPNEEDIRMIVNAARWATSAANSQHWHFVWNNKTLNLYNQHSRTRELYSAGGEVERISLGAVVENIRISASHLGLNLKTEFTSSLNNSKPAVIISFSEDTELNAVENNSLYPHIFSRCTNRKLYYDTKISKETVNELTEFSAAGFNNSTHWLTENKDMERSAQMVFSADNIAWQYEGLHRALMHWVRLDKRSSKYEGMNPQILELNFSKQILLRIIRHWQIVKLLQSTGISRRIAAGSYEWMKHSSAHCLITTKDTSDTGYIKAGMAVQRFWLKATSLGLSLHPMNGPILLIEHLKNNPESFLNKHIKEIHKIKDDLIWFSANDKSETPVMLFRLGYSDMPSERSGRLEVDELLTIL